MDLVKFLRAGRLIEESHPEWVNYASMAKYFVTKVVFCVVDRTLQSYGGVGLFKSPHIMETL